MDKQFNSLNCFQYSFQITITIANLAYFYDLNRHFTDFSLKKKKENPIILFWWHSKNRCNWKVTEIFVLTPSILSAGY